MNAPLPALANEARLPRSYEAARLALAECQGLDECKDWADKAAALASYARQAEDDQLERMAQRIRARAIRRAGELLRQIEPAPNHHVTGVGAHTSRSDAAREAGMSKHQQVQATRIAAIPERDFDEQVESDAPPTLTQLAQQGIRPAPRQPVDLGGRDPKAFNRALHFTALVTEYAAELANAGATEIIPHLDDRQRTKLRSALAHIDAIHDQIATRI
jgi:hypothetical protein